MHNFLITDDDVFSRGGMALSLKNFYPGCTVHEARAVKGALEVLGENRQIGLVLLDLNVDDSRGIDTLRTLKRWCENQDFNPRIVVVSGGADYDDTLIPEAIENCATGFIPKGCSESVFRSAVDITLAGSIYIPERYLIKRATSASAYKEAPADVTFTRREQQVAALLLQGLSYKQIAHKLEKADGKPMSEHTVRVHVQRMAWKLRLTDVTSSGTLSAKSAVLTAFAQRRLQFSL